MNTLYFVVPVYNVAQYLPRCVESLLQQTYKNTKIVLVNDGSKDNGGTICDSYAAAYENVTVIHKENGGLSSARNAGLDFCFQSANEKDWLMFVDADDFLHPDCGTRTIEIAEENQCDIVQCDYEKGEKDAFTPMEKPPFIEITPAKEALLGYRLKSQMCAKLYRLQLFSNQRFRLGVLNEDEFLTYRIVYSVPTVAFTDEVLYYYYQRHDSIMATIAKRIKNNPHSDDWYHAYLERADFFAQQNEPDLVLKTYEKICIDVILRQTEQRSLPKEQRDDAVVNGSYKKRYNRYYKKMMGRKGLPFFKKWMYRAFYLYPDSAYIASRFKTLRK